MEARSWGRHRTTVLEILRRVPREQLVESLLKPAGSALLDMLSSSSTISTENRKVVLELIQSLEVAPAQWEGRHVDVLVDQLYVAKPSLDHDPSVEREVVDVQRLALEILMQLPIGMIAGEPQEKLKGAIRREDTFPDVRDMAQKVYAWHCVPTLFHNTDFQGFNNSSEEAARH